MDQDGNESQIVAETGGPVLAIFGAFFACIGMVCVIPFLIHPAAIIVNGHPGSVKDIWFGLIFVFIGLGMVGCRYRRTVDLGKRRVETAWGWMLWIKRTFQATGRWEAIVMGPAEDRGSRNRYSCYPVRMVTADGDVEICALRLLEKARFLCERIAVSANIPFTDKSEGAPFERQAETIGVGLLARPGPPEIPVPAPPGTQVRSLPGLRGTCIRLPPRLLGPAFGMIGLLIPFGVWWFWWRPGLPQQAKAHPVALVFLYLPLLGLVVLPALTMMFRAWRNGSFGTVIRVDDIDGLRTGGRCIRPADLEELRIGSENGVSFLIAGSMAKVIRLGRGLVPDDLAYLRSEILRALRG